MASPAQILANRENAQHSTGPTSIEGKDKAKMNALRSGLTARGLIIPLGLEDAFAKLEDDLRLNLRPVGGLEETIFTHILECAWNLRRCRIAEAQLFASSEDQSIDPLLDVQNEAKYARIQKYFRQNENSMLKFMKELGRLQTEMQVRNQLCPLTDEILDDPEQFEATPQYRSAACDFTKVAKSNKYRLRNQHAPVTANLTARELLEAFIAPPTQGLAASGKTADFQNEAKAA